MSRWSQQQNLCGAGPLPGSQTSSYCSIVPSWRRSRALWGLVEKGHLPHSWGSHLRMTWSLPQSPTLNTITLGIRFPISEDLVGDPFDSQQTWILLSLFCSWGNCMSERLSYMSNSYGCGQSGFCLPQVSKPFHCNKLINRIFTFVFQHKP